MKQIKKFWGVFLALAMVVGMVGMMPVVEAKAAENITATLVVPEIGVAVEELIITFGTEIDSGPTRADRVFSLLKVNDDDLTSSLGGNGTAVWNTTTKVTVEIPETTFALGDVLTIQFSANYVMDEDENTVEPLTYEFEATPTPTPGGGGTATEGDAGVGLKVTDADVISFDYDTSVLTINDIADDNEESSYESTVVYVAFGKSANLDATAIAKLKYDAYLFDGYIELNLSAISPKKDSFIYLYTDAYMKVVQFTIAKNDAKAKIVFDFSKTKLSEVIKDKNDKVELKDLQVRTPEGMWDFVEEHFGDGADGIDISQLDYYTAYGATLYFRAAGVDTDNPEGDEPVIPTQFASAEFKVKVPKEAKAPKVTVDGAKETIKYGKGLEILKIDPNDSANNEWLPLTSTGATVEMKNLVGTGTTDNEKLFGNKDDGIYAVVRTQGTDKKPASKIAVVSLAGEAAAEDVKEKLGLDGETPSVKIVEATNANKTTKTIVVDNDSEYDIEFYVGASTATGPTGKWTKVKAGKEGKVTKTEAVAGKFIFIRLASVKDSVTKINSIPSAQVELGVCPVWVSTAPTAAPTAAPAAPAPTLNASVTPATNNGTKLTVNGAPGENNSFVYKISETEVTTPKVGDDVSGTILITGTDTDDIAATVDEYIAVYEVDSEGNVVRFKLIKLAAEDINS